MICKVPSHLIVNTFETLKRFFFLPLHIDTLRELNSQRRRHRVISSNFLSFSASVLLFDIFHQEDYDRRVLQPISPDFAAVAADNQGMSRRAVLDD